MPTTLLPVLLAFRGPWTDTGGLVRPGMPS